MANDILSVLISKVLGEQVQETALVKTLYSIRMESLARLLQLRIANLQTPVDRQTCRSIIEDISEEGAERLLRSPALCEVLRAGTDKRALIKLLTVALVSSSGDFVDEWSVIGDSWLGRTRPKRYPGLMQRYGRFWSPQLACGVPVDLSLAEYIKNPSAGLREPFIPAESELNVNITHINKALELLSYVYPLGYSIFESLVSNIVVRGDAGRTMECWGASSGISIGRVVIVNAVSQPDIRMLGETLLHEATHCALDCVELIKPLWQITGSEGVHIRSSIASPWTSNELTLHAFLHACVVWSILLRYWDACDRRYGADDTSQARRGFIESGFVNLDEQVDLDQALQSLTIAAFDTVMAARQSVQLSAHSKR